MYWRIGAAAAGPSWDRADMTEFGSWLHCGGGGFVGGGARS